MFKISTADDTLEVEKEERLTYITTISEHGWDGDERATVVLDDSQVKELIHYLNSIVKEK